MDKKVKLIYDNNTFEFPLVEGTRIIRELLEFEPKSKATVTF